MPRSPFYTWPTEGVRVGARTRETRVGKAEPVRNQVTEEQLGRGGAAAGGIFLGGAV